MEQLGVQNLENVDERGLEGSWRVSTADHRVLLEAVLLKVHETATKRELHQSLEDQFRCLDQNNVGAQVQRPLEIGRSESGRTFLVLPIKSRHPLQDDLAPTTARTWRTSVEIITDVARSISQVHQAGLVHGQLDPTTIRVALGKETVVTSFGLAGFATDRWLSAASQQESVPHHYLAPEVLQGQPADQRSDVYGLGISLYASLLGSMPFASATDFSELTDQIISASLPELDDHIPLEVREVVRQATSKQPLDRHLDATAFLLDLQTATPPIQLSDHQPAFIPSVQGSGSRISIGLVPRVAIIAAFFLGLGAIGAFASSRSPGVANQEQQIEILGTTTVPETTTVDEAVTSEAPTSSKPASTEIGSTTEDPSSTTTEASSSGPTATPRSTTVRPTTPSPTTTVQGSTTSTTEPTTSSSTTTSPSITIKPGPTSTPTTTVPTTPVPTTTAPTTAEPGPEPTAPSTTVRTVPSFTVPTFTLPSIPGI